MEKDSTKKIIDAYQEVFSIKGASVKTGYSWQRIVKALSSQGIIANDRHGKILQLYKEGNSIEQIAQMLSIAPSTVKAYLPRVRKVYGEQRSLNALRIKKSRDSKKKRTDGQENRPKRQEEQIC